MSDRPGGLVGGIVLVIGGLWAAAGQHEVTQHVQEEVAKRGGDDVPIAGHSLTWWIPWMVTAAGGLILAAPIVRKLFHLEPAGSFAFASAASETTKRRMDETQSTVAPPSVPGVLKRERAEREKERAELTAKITAAEAGLADAGVRIAALTRNNEDLIRANADCAKIISAREDAKEAARLERSRRDWLAKIIEPFFDEARGGSGTLPNPVEWQRLLRASATQGVRPAAWDPIDAQIDAESLNSHDTWSFFRAVLVSLPPLIAAIKAEGFVDGDPDYVPKSDPAPPPTAADDLPW